MHRHSCIVYAKRGQYMKLSPLMLFLRRAGAWGMIPDGEYSVVSSDQA